MAHHQQQVVEEKVRQIMASSSSSSTLFCYPDPNTHTHLAPHLQSFDPNPDIYNLAAGIEMIGFQPKPTNISPHDPILWKELSAKTNGSVDLGPSKGPDSLYGAYVDDSCDSPRTCVFPCEGNERPSQGLSLSLSSNNPSTIGLQSFELRHQTLNHQRLMLSTNSLNPQHHEASFLGKSDVLSLNMQFEMMRNSRFLRATQELLNEFCSLGSDGNDKKQFKKKKKDKEHWEFLDGDDHDRDDDHRREVDDNNNNNNTNNMNNGGSSSSSQSNLYGLSLLELQKRKTKLLALLEELDRRYKHYCEQMKGVVASFEGLAGSGSGHVYTALASKAMSRHFRSLRDAIVGEVKGCNKAMGEKDAVPGATRGETPRLRVLDQALRQQRAYQQMSMMETHPWRPQRGLPERSVSILRAWLFEHFLHPYPSDVDKHILARQTGLTRSQVSNWFINARVRLWKPMVEQMYLEETKEEQERNIDAHHDLHDHHHHSNQIGALIQPSNDQKPTPDQLLRVEPESLSSIINTTTTTKSDRNNPHDQNPNHDLHHAHHFGRVEAFGSIDLDFPSSSTFHHNNHHHHHHASYPTQNDENAHQSFGLGGSTGGGNVSLTLGLQQLGGSVAFSPASQTTLFYGRDQIDDCQPAHQYSLLDGDQAQNLPYRNLMGAQLLHDFA